MSKIKARFKTAKGRANFPHLNQPDTKFNAEGVYKTGLIVNAKDAAETIKIAKDVARQAFGGDPKKLKRCALPFEENDDGTVTFKFKSYNKPTVFDAKGNVVKDAKIGGGSVLKIAGSFESYDKGANLGVTAYLNSVLLLELQSFGSNPFAGDEDEGTFEAGEDEGNEFANGDSEDTPAGGGAFDEDEDIPF